MQQAHPAAQASRLLSSAFYLLFSRSARAPENQKYAIQEVCGEHLLGVVSSYRGLLYHSVLVIFEGLMAERVERSPNHPGLRPSTVQEGSFPFLTLHIHIH